MNYNDQILENKPFNFFKQLMYNIALSICILLVGVLVMVYGFKFRLYEVLSDSQYPAFKTGDMVVVKPQKSYKIGDIIKFNQGELPVTHRLIGMVEESGITYYICHGDNVQSVNPNRETYTVPWQDDAAYVQSLINQNYTLNEIAAATENEQIVSASQVEGIVIGHLNSYGTYFHFIQSHWGLLVALVAAIWCISSTVQNEIDMKKSRRLI